MATVLLIIGLVLFVGLVVIHEYGHFIAARKGGVDVEEFGIGFPPKAWKRRVKSPKGDYDFTINWLPLGGFVRLKGESDDATEPGAFGAAPLGVKVKIMVAGVIMNLITAFVLFTIVAWIGMPQLPQDAIGSQFTVSSDETVVSEVQNKDVVLVGRVVESSPAAEAGIQEGEEIVSLNGTEINHPQDIVDLTQENVGQEVKLIVRATGTKDGVQPSERTVFVALNDADTAANDGYIGIAPISGQEGFAMVRYTWSAPIVAAGTMAQFTQLTFVGLGQALSGFGSYLVSFVTGNQEVRQEGQAQATEQITGPLGIFFTLVAVSQEGIALLLFIIALISLALAIMNVLPIPALDGGRLFVTLLFRAIKRPLPKSLEEKIHGTGFLVLMILFVLITIIDFRRFF